MLKINLTTGLAWSIPIYCNGDEHSDLIDCINEWYRNHRSFPVSVYSLYEIELYDIQGTAIPINGGEFYIEGIDSVREINFKCKSHNHFGIMKTMKMVKICKVEQHRTTYKIGKCCSSRFHYIDFSFADVYTILNVCKGE